MLISFTPTYCIPRISRRNDLQISVWSNTIIYQMVSRGNPSMNEAFKKEECLPLRIAFSRFRRLDSCLSGSTKLTNISHSWFRYVKCPYIYPALCCKTNTFRHTIVRSSLIVISTGGGIHQRISTCVKHRRNNAQYIYKLTYLLAKI